MALDIFNRNKVIYIFNEKIQTITQAIAVGGLVIALFLSILYDRTELSTNIASGLVGFIGGAAIIRKENDKWH